MKNLLHINDWSYNDTATKINVNDMLSKVAEFINIKILKSVYYATFDCHINYANTVWGLNKNSMNWLISQQKKLSILWVLNAEIHIQIYFF